MEQTSLNGRADLQQAGDGDDGSGEVREDSRVAVAVELEDRRGITRRADTLRSPSGLADVVVADGVDDVLDQSARTVGDGFLQNLQLRPPTD